MKLNWVVFGVRVCHRIPDIVPLPVITPLVEATQVPVHEPHVPLKSK